MGEQTFRSAGFFDREINLVAPAGGPVGTPAGVIGTAQKGAAFVPVTVGTFSDFVSNFGTLDPKKFGPYAVNEFLKHGNALTYIRVLGAGANDSTEDIETTRLTGQVKNAGFVVTGSTVDGLDLRHQGAVQFIVARHTVSTNEAIGFPMFTDNDSYVATVGSDEARIVRAVVMTASGTRLLVADGDEVPPSVDFGTLDDVASINSSGKFKLIVSSTVKQTILTASLNPTDADYISKILNTNPEKFPENGHLLYCDFAVDNELAAVSTATGSIGMMSGSGNASDSSGDTAMLYRDAYGHYDTRYTTPKTTSFISQPFGTTEFDLFYFEALDDGAWSNTEIKISIADIRASSEPNNDFGTFTVQVRRFDDADVDAEIIERFPGCTLDPQSENYIAARIGDIKARYVFDADDEDERRVEIDGKYPNKSTTVRVVVNESVERGEVPSRVLPFGFRGLQLLKTNHNGTDGGTIVEAQARLAAVTGSLGTDLTGSILPPVPFRFKVTRGEVATSGFAGAPGIAEEVDGRLYWGVKTTRNTTPLNPNTTKKVNSSVAAFTKMAGLVKLDVLSTGSAADSFNENKFTLARVAFSNAAVAELTGTAEAHMKEAAYIRNGEPDATEYTINDGVLSGRITFGTLVAQTSSADFNRFTTYLKYTNLMYGGFDGVNILDKNSARLNDKAASSDLNGGASSGYLAPGLDNNPSGVGKDNNIVFAYRAAAQIMTDPLSPPVNIPNGQTPELLAVPGMRDSFITDFVADKVKEFARAIYVMDLVEYDDQTNRLFDDDAAKPDVQKTSEQFDTRAINNNYAATYFPDIIIGDAVNNRTVKVPPSVAVLGAIAFNDRVGYPWFAPAGFNRGSLDFVRSLDVRLKKNDRDVLQDARINPIANFPPQTKVIFGQKTLQQAQTALDRVNVRRLMISVKRAIEDVAQRVVFDQNTPELRARFVSQTVPILALIQAQSGIEAFDVVMDDRNNTKDDELANRVNGKIVIVPTRTAEFIAIDFVVDDAGVTFQ
jgi:hypothetical protein